MSKLTNEVPKWTRGDVEQARDKAQLALDHFRSFSPNGEVPIRKGALEALVALADAALALQPPSEEDAIRECREYGLSAPCAVADFLLAAEFGHYRAVAALGLGEG